jgi:hypothetical protein
MANHWTEPVGGQRRDDAPGSASQSGAEYLGREVERLAIAMARSNARLLVGTTSLIGNLLVNVNELVLGRLLGGLRLGDAFGIPPGSGATAGRGRVEQAAARTGGIIEGISGVVTGAVRDSANLVTRSVEDFSRAYEEELGSIWRPQPRRPGAGSSAAH